MVFWFVAIRFLRLARRARKGYKLLNRFNSDERFRPCGGSVRRRWSGAAIKNRFLWPCPAVAEVAKAHDLFVVEDCAQAIGARGDRFAIGEWSDAVCLSFIIQKNLGCFGDGGAVATNHQDLATKIRKLRNHGSLKRSYHSIGYNSRLDDLHAAVLRVKLKHAAAW